MADEYVVSYKAVADFSKLIREAKQARREIERLRAAEGMSGSKTSSTSGVSGSSNVTNARRQEAAATTKAATAVDDLTDSTKTLGRESKQTSQHVSGTQAEIAKLSTASRSAASGVDNLTDSHKALGREVGSGRRAMEAMQAQIRATAAENERHLASLRRSTSGHDDHANAVKRSEKAVASWGAALVQSKTHMANSEKQLLSWGAVLNKQASSAGGLGRSIDNLSKSALRGNNALSRLFFAIKDNKNTDAMQGALSKLGKQASSLAGSFMSLGKFLMIGPLLGAAAAALNMLIPLLGAAGGAVMGLATSLSSLVGVAAALPGLLAAAASAVGGLLISFSGVPATFKAFTQLTKAQRNAAPVVQKTISQAEKLKRAQQDLKRSHQDLKWAEEDLTKARKDALRSLQALRIEVGRAGLNEEGAAADVKKAREDWMIAMADSSATAGDRAQALYNLHRAEANQQDVIKQNVQNREDLNDAEKKGVDGSRSVIQAQRGVEDAQRRVIDAQIALINARKGDAKAQSAATTAANAYADAMKKLSPSAQKTVKWILGMRGAWDKMRKTIQENFFGQFVGELNGLKKLVGPVTRFFSVGAREAGKFVKWFIGPDAMASKGWIKDLGTVTNSTRKILHFFFEALKPLITGFKDVMVAAAPFTEWLANGVGKGAKTLGELLSRKSKNGDLAHWLKYTLGPRLIWVKEIFKNTGKALYGFFSAAGDLGDWILKKWAKISEGWATAGENAKKPGSAFREWLNDLKPALSEIAKIFSTIFKGFAKRAKDNLPDLAPLLKQFREKLLPAISGLMDALGDPKNLGALTDAVVSIINALTDLLKNGGGQGITKFLEGFALAMQALAAVAKIPVVGQILTSLLAIAAVGSGMAFALSPLIKVLSMMMGAKTAVAGFMKLWRFLRTGSTAAKVADAVPDVVKTGVEATKVTKDAAKVGTAATKIPKTVPKAPGTLPKILSKVPGAARLAKITPGLSLAIAGAETGYNATQAWQAGQASGKPAGGAIETANYVRQVATMLSPWEIYQQYSRGVKGWQDSSAKGGSFWDNAMGFATGYNPLRYRSEDAPTPASRVHARANTGDASLLIAKKRPKKPLPALPGLGGASLPNGGYTTGAGVSTSAAVTAQATKANTKAVTSLATTKKAVQDFVTTVPKMLSDAWTKVSTDVALAWASIVKSFIDGLTKIKAQSSVIGGQLISNFNVFVTTVKSIFSGLVTAMAQIFEKMKQATIAPVTFIINTVLGGLVKAINQVLTALGASTIPVPTTSLGGGKGLPNGGYTTGAGVTNRNRGGSIPGTGSKDTVPAMLTPGEFVIRKDAVRSLEAKHPGMLRGLNAGGAGALRGRQFFADGGMVGSLATAVGDAVGNAVSGADVATMTTEKGAAGALRALTAPIAAVASSAASTFGVFGQLASLVAHKVLGTGETFVSGQETSLASSEPWTGKFIPPPSDVGPSALMSWAYKYLRGTPYSADMGRQGPGVGFGCSNFTQYVAGKAGVKFPAPSPQQMHYGTRVNPNSIQPGDALFWQFPWGNNKSLARGPGQPNHVGFYYGNGMILDSSGGHGVGLHPFGGGYAPGQGHFLQARRIFSQSRLSGLSGSAAASVRTARTKVDPLEFAFGGLVPPLAPAISPLGNMTAAVASGAQSNRYGPQFGNININNPVPERSSESLYRTVQKMTLGY